MENTNNNSADHISAPTEEQKTDAPAKQSQSWSTMNLFSVSISDLL